MSDTPETDVSCGYALSSHYGRLEGSYLQMDWSGPFVHAEVARKLERERDEAREARNECERQFQEKVCEIAQLLSERDEAREERDKLQIMRNEVVAANKGAKINAQVSNSLAGKLNQAERERDEARKEIENVKLQLRLWEDGNLICEETLGEIRLFEEQIKQALLERNKAHEIADQAIEDLAWFNETNAQRLRNELEQLKEETK